MDPGPLSPLAQIRPPCDSMIASQIARAMPLPSGFVVRPFSSLAQLSKSRNVLFSFGGAPVYSCGDSGLALHLIMRIC